MIIVILWKCVSLRYLMEAWFHIFNRILYLFEKILKFALRKESFVTFPARRGGSVRPFLDWLIEGIARGRSWWNALLHSLTPLLIHSLTPVMKWFWARNACLRQSLRGISLKTGKFPTSFNSETSVYTKQS